MALFSIVCGDLEPKMSRRELMRSSSVISLNCLHRVVEGDASKSICHFLIALAHKADTLS